MHPAHQLDLAGQIGQRVTLLEFRHIATAAEQHHVEITGIGFVADQEVTRAQRPVFLVKIRHRAVGQPEPVRRIVERARRPDRPVEEILARIVGVRIRVENVVHRELADLDAQAGHVALAGHLAVVALDRFLLTAKSECMTQEQARGVVARIRKVRLLRFAVRETARARRAVEAEALQQFGIVIDLAAVPDAHAEKYARGPRRFRLRPRRETVGAVIRRTECRIPLENVGRLTVQLPINSIRRACGLHRPPRRIGEAIGETETRGPQIETRRISGAARRLHIARAEIRVEHFRAQRPRRGKGIFDASAGGPAEPRMRARDIVVGVRRGHAHRMADRRRETAGDIGQPIALRATDAGAYAAETAERLGDKTARRRPGPHGISVRLRVRKCQIGLDTQHQAVAGLDVVAAEYTARETAEPRLPGRHRRAAQDRRDGPAAVADMDAKIRAVPARRFRRGHRRGKQTSLRNGQQRTAGPGKQTQRHPDHGATRLARELGRAR